MRHYSRLSHYDRNRVQSLFTSGESRRSIARIIGKSHSTVCRELARNARRGQRYEGTRAQRISKRRLSCKKVKPHQIQGLLEEEVSSRLQKKHSPEQIANTIRSCRTASTSTIYRHIRRNASLGGKLYTHLRIRRKRPYRRRTRPDRSAIPNRTPLENRPEIVNKRRRYGDWEADLVEGRGHTGYILTLCERKSRFLVLRKLESKHAKGVSKQIVDGLKNYKVQTITYDNGTEFWHHEEVNKKLKCKSFFCAPYHSWEKGSVEHVNGLIRQFHQKTESFENLNQSELNKTALELNTRPRKLLNDRSPMDFVNELRK